MKSLTATLTGTAVALAMVLILPAACSNDDTPVEEAPPPSETITPDTAPADEPGHIIEDPETYSEPDTEPAPEVDAWWVVVPDNDMYMSIHTYFDGVAIANYASSGYGGSVPNQNTFTALDINGNEIFPPTDKYYYISPFSHGMAVVDAKASYEDDSIYGLIDINGNEIVPPGKYDRFMTGNNGEPTDTAIIVQTSDWKYGVIDNTGIEIVPIGKYSQIFEFNCGVAIVRSSDDEYSFIDTTGKEIVPFGEYVIYYFKDDVAVVTSSDWKNKGIIDTAGNVLVPLGELNYGNVAAFSDGAAVVSNWDDGTWGVIDKTGTEIIPLSSNYKFIRDFIDGVAVAEDTDGKYGVIDKSGNIVVPFGKYDQIDNFNCGVAVVNDYTNNVTGVIDTSGNEVVPLGKYGRSGLTFTNGYAVTQVQFDDGSDPFNLVLDNTGREIIYASFREFSPHHTVSKEGLLIVHENQRAGVIDLNKWPGN